MSFNLTALQDPDGAGSIVHGTLRLAGCRDGVRRETTSRVLAARWTPVEVSRAVAGPDAGLTGAGLTVLDDVVRDPAAWMARRHSSVPLRRTALGPSAPPA